MLLPDPYALLDPKVQDRLSGLRAAGVVTDGMFDRRAIMYVEIAVSIAASSHTAVRSLAELPPSAALEVLKPLNKAFVRQLSSPAGWLTTQCRRIGSNPQ